MRESARYIEFDLKYQRAAPTSGLRLPHHHLRMIPSLLRCGRRLNPPGYEDLGDRRITLSEPGVNGQGKGKRHGLSQLLIVGPGNAGFEKSVDKQAV